MFKPATHSPLPEHALGHSESAHSAPLQVASQVQVSFPVQVPLPLQLATPPQSKGSQNSGPMQVPFWHDVQKNDWQSGGA